VKQKPPHDLIIPDGNEPPSSDYAVLKTRLPVTLLRFVRRHAALGNRTLDDFVREAIEERLRSS
jgi:hypothetical protein